MSIERGNISLAAIVAVGVLLVASSEPAHSQRAIADATVSGGRLGFDGYATPGPWSAWTDSVSGRLTGAADIGHVRGWVAFPAATLDSDNARRDKDMRKSLEVDKYPVIRFDLHGVTPSEASADSSTVVLGGTFDIHGVQRQVEMEATVVFGESDIRVTAQYQLNLEDYEIGGLSKMLGMLKMQKMITLHIDVIFAAD